MQVLIKNSGESVVKVNTLERNKLTAALRVAGAICQHSAGQTKAAASIAHSGILGLLDSLSEKKEDVPAPEAEPKPY